MTEAARNAPLRVQEARLLIAQIKQFGESQDGAVERDLLALYDRLADENRRLNAELTHQTRGIEREREAAKGLTEEEAKQRLCPFLSVSSPVCMASRCMMWQFLAPQNEADRIRFDVPPVGHCSLRGHHE